MKVQFVCNGNTFRSRLAEAYFNSKKPKGWEASSSGISASKNENGPITWSAQRIISNNNLVPFESFSWKQTTKEEIENASIVIFMKEEYYEYATKTLGVNVTKYEIWKINDLCDIGFSDEHDSLEDDYKRMQAAEEVFKQIKEKVDRLILSL